jgi:hypothetical protein
MSDSSAPAPKAQSPAIFYLLCVMLIGTFLWRAFIPANEYPSRTAQLLEMAIDAAMIVGLVGLRKLGPMPLFVIALIAGIGLFAIRLHGDASWWTGHWNYSLRR